MDVFPTVYSPNRFYRDDHKHTASLRRQIDHMSPEELREVVFVGDQYHASSPLGKLWKQLTGRLPDSDMYSLAQTKLEELAYRTSV